MQFSANLVNQIIPRPAVKCHGGCPFGFLFDAAPAVGAEGAREETGPALRLALGMGGQLDRPRICRGCSIHSRKAFSNPKRLPISSAARESSGGLTRMSCAPVATSSRDCCSINAHAACSALSPKLPRRLPALICSAAPDSIQE